jgi:hypothetical protein
LRRAARRDRNHGEIVEAFGRLGCSVIDVASIPCGFDLLIGYGGLTIPVEVKDGLKPPSKRKLTKNEKKIHDRWTGGKRIVENVEQAAETANLLRRWHLAICAAVKAG